MPGVALHFLVAQRALERFRASTDDPPFDLDDPVAINAFYHGSVGPDLGYFPGGHRPLSHLSHSVRTGALTRTLIRGSRTVRERAYSLGWLTHVLADRQIHPWIGRGVGELLEGCRETFVDGSTDFLAHLRVEMGVDAWVASRFPEIRAIRLDPVFDEQSIGFLARAYARVYQVPLGSELFLQSHLSAGKRAGQALASLGVVGTLMDETSWPGLRWALRAAYETGGSRHVSLAYLNPVRPPAWLTAAVDDELESLSDLVWNESRTGAATLADHNLDTGKLLIDETEHVGTRQALQYLMAQGRWGATPNGRQEPAGDLSAAERSEARSARSHTPPEPVSRRLPA